MRMKIKKLFALMSSLLLYNHFNMIKFKSCLICYKNTMKNFACSLTYNMRSDINEVYMSLGYP